MTVFAGTNGSGKSTYTRTFREERPEVLIIDPDAIARTINPQNPESASFAAGKETLKLVDRCIREKTDFSIETTLAGGNVLRQMQKARESGFKIDLIYVGVKDVEINLKRVAERVLKGGHRIPTEDVLRRYPASLANLPKAIRLADTTRVMDNSDYHDLQVVLNKNQLVFQNEKLTDWVRNAMKDWELAGPETPQMRLKDVLIQAEGLPAKSNAFRLNAESLNRIVTDYGIEKTGNGETIRFKFQHEDKWNELKTSTQPPFQKELKDKWIERAAAGQSTPAPEKGLDR